METNTATLEHANLNVTDLERSLSFYRRLLPAWVIRWEGSTSDGSRWVHFGPAEGRQPGYLSLYEDRGAKPQHDGDGLRVQHLGFAHPDVSGLVDELSHAGIRPTDAVEDRAYRRAYFQDPDGHELEMVQKL